MRNGLPLLEIEDRSVNQYLTEMKIAILGTGAIGSVFGYQMAKAGHSVTAIARGKRLEQLQRDSGVTMVSGEQVALEVCPTLDPAVPYDLVLVTVLATQVEPLLATLRQSVAKRVMFMFNTFESLDPLRNAVGGERFAFGFPMGVFCLLIDGKIRPQIRRGTTTSDSAWAKVFSEAGIPTSVDVDMHNWLRSHAALVIPLMSAGTIVAGRRGGITWSEARAHAQAMSVAFGIVRNLGHKIVPSEVATISRMPQLVNTFLLWVLSRTALLRDLGKLGATEPRMLIDMMVAAAPGKGGALLAIRP